jgi:hypothetical protein
LAKDFAILLPKKVTLFCGKIVNFLSSYMHSQNYKLTPARIKNFWFATEKKGFQGGVIFFGQIVNFLSSYAFAKLKMHHWSMY